MVVRSSYDINKEKDKKKKISLYFYDVSSYIIIIIDKIIILLKNAILKEKTYYFINKVEKTKFPSSENDLFKVKNESITTTIKKETKKILNNNKAIKENKIAKRKNNIKHSNKINRKYIKIIILIKFIIINIYYQLKNIKLFFSQFSKITLKIKGIGESNIFPYDRIYKFGSINSLKEVIINGNQEAIKYKYYLNQTDNFVELIWDDNITDCTYMFHGCYNITEINLSNFNTSQVTCMFSMFEDCSSLTSLDLSNLDTSQVTEMYGMFKNCSSLTSLNLSDFNTSQDRNMNQMFAQCVKLEYINLKNFDDSKAGDIYNMFNSVSKNAVICLQETDTQLNILSKIL